MPAREIRKWLLTFTPFPSKPTWSHPKVRCDECGHGVSVWCVDCKKQLCPACASRLHQPGISTTEFHSVEEILFTEGRHGVRVITPLIGLLFGLFGGWCIFDTVRRRYNSDIMSTPEICPVASFIGPVLARIDSKLFYYMKGQLTQYCGTEDSLYRLFLDFWVRDIVTDTDDTLLLLLAAPQALLVLVTYNKVLVPLVTYPYGLLASIAHKLEANLYRSPTLQLLEKILSVVDVNRLTGTAKLPLLTKWRRRGCRDTADRWEYFKERQTRYFKFYRSSLEQHMKHYLTTWVFGIIVVRLGFIWFRHLTGLKFSVFLRTILSSVGLEKMLQQQQDMFQGVTSDLVTTETLMGLSFWTMGKAWSWADWFPTHRVASSVASLGSEWQIWHAVIFAFVFYAMLKHNVVHQYYWNPRINRERAQFNHDWKHGERARCLGEGTPHAHDEVSVWPYGGSEPWGVSQTLPIKNMIDGVRDLTSYSIEDAVLALNKGQEHEASKEGMCIVKSTSTYSKGQLFLLYRFDMHDKAQKKVHPPTKAAADGHKKDHPADDHKKKHDHKKK
eukprot:TRINITY_DN16567_c0_g1_i1.p1 TRINITY_DN16567_c0_g1~~TRINITY_DN16567_c0_g1_i1.p1  ORF type:complete len:649 (-),score=88.32 TRINITY_DN16567_c0_g1_i1:113-1783(-)